MKHCSIIIISVSFSLLLLLSLLGSLLELGEHLSNFNQILGYIYFLLIALCLCAGILYPVLYIWRQPIFSMYMLRDKEGRARRRWCRKLTNNLIRYTALTDEEKAILPSLLNNGNETDDLLIDFFQEKFTPVVETEIKKSAKAAFLATAISQTSFYDMLSMLSINLQQIKNIVESCGYRPSTPVLLGLYVRVLKAVFLAGGMEEMDLEELLPMLSGNAALKLPGLVLASAAQGTVNAFTTIRVGIITRDYLFSADGPLCMKEAKKNSYKEAMVLLKSSGLYKDFLELIGRKAGNIKEAAAASVKNSVKKVWRHPKGENTENSLTSDNTMPILIKSSSCSADEQK